jgi:hypothetical protein
VTQSPDTSGQESDRSPSPPGDDQDSVSADPDDALIDEIGEESFPASDSPSLWSGPPTESRRH